MKKHLRLALILGLAGVGSTGSAQEDDHAPTPGAASLAEAHTTGRALVIGSGRSASYVPPIYTVQRGDTLWDITGRFYGNPYEWPRVWSYNPEITNPHWIYPLDRIRLRPGAEQAAPALPVASTGRTGRVPPGTVWLRDEGYLDREALDEAGVVIGSPEEHMLLATYDEVYVRFEEGVRVQPGREYTIFRVIDDEERNPDERGDLVRIFGTVRLRSYDPERGVGRATITEALDPIERGYRIAPVPRRFEVVPPVPNSRDVESEVVATLRPQQILGDYQIVFVAAGSEEGVQLGNRWFVIREGDEWRRNLTADLHDYGETVEDAPELDEDEFPPEVIAEGRVVAVRPHSSTVLITASTREVVVGDKVELRQGF